MRLIREATDYALRAVVWLAEQADRPHTVEQLAAATGAPAGYLIKVLQQLIRAGILRSRRGIHGGYQLNRTAEAISLLDVVSAIEPIPRIRTCPLNLESHGISLCPLHRSIDDVLADVEKMLGTHTIADLLAESASDKAESLKSTARKGS